MHQGTRNGNALPHTARKGANQRSATRIQTNFVEKFFGARGGLRNTLKFAKEHQIFLGREFVVDHRGVRDVAGLLIYRGFAGAARERQLSCRGANDPGGDAQESGLAGTVAASQDNTFAWADFQRDAAQSE